MKREHMSVGPKSIEFRHAMKNTMVRAADGGVRLVHAPGSHGPEGYREIFSNRENAAYIAGLRDLSEIHSVFLDLRSPLVIPRFPATDTHASTLVHMELGLEPGSENYDELAFRIRKYGYDSIAFGDTENINNVLWWPMGDKDIGIYPQLTGPIENNYEPWQIEREDWLNVENIGEQFDIQGREEEYDDIFRALDLEGPDLPVMTRNPDGYEVRWLNDFTPSEEFIEGGFNQAFMGLFDPLGNACGFYAEGQIWIDENARGAGRSSSMILAAVNLLGTPPALNSYETRYSPAGYAAHMSAYNLMQNTMTPEYIQEIDNVQPEY